MDKIKLTKREYLGEGYIFEFRNKNTGSRIIIPCTKEEYQNLAKGVEYNPELENYTFVGGAGGTIKVDTENSTLGSLDYTDIGDSYLVGLRCFEVSKDKIVDNYIDADLHKEANTVLIPIN